MNKVVFSYLTISVIIFQSCNTQKYYVRKAIDIMEHHALHKDSVDWKSVRTVSLKEAKNTTSLKDTYPIIQSVLNSLKDHHSFLITPGRKEHMYSAIKPVPIIESELINGNIAYIRIPSFTGKGKKADTYTNRLIAVIQNMDRYALKGWIIDLTANTGGNMWPMLGGLSPLLPEGTFGYFTDVFGVSTPWRYKNDVVYLGDQVIQKIENPYLLKNENKPIGVLIGNLTASSGEAVAVSFTGMHNTKFFGENTLGLTTGNTTFELSDGALLALTTSIFEDKNHEKYGNAIKPDHYSVNPKEDAISWISDISDL